MTTPILLSQTLPEFRYHLYGGCAQFSNIHILESPSGYHFAQIFPLETSIQIRDDTELLESLQRIMQQSHPFILIPDRVGRLSDQSLFLLGSLPPLSSLETGATKAQSGIPLTGEEISALGSAVLRLLSTLHNQNTVHGSITPASILIAQKEIWLIDAGVEQVLRKYGIDTTQLPSTLQAPYISPEQIAGNPPTPASDIYALGAVLYHLATGKLPFGGRTTTMVMASVLTDEVIEETVSGNQKPGHIVQAILRAIEKDPADRWTSASHFESALQLPALTYSLPADTQAAQITRSGCLPALGILTSASLFSLYYTLR